MPKFRKKPVVIEAVQFTGDNWTEIREWMGKDNHQSYFDARDGMVIIGTLEGEMSAIKGDWIIRGVSGELYPIKPDIFQKTYEPAE